MMNQYFNEIALGSPQNRGTVIDSKDMGLWVRKALIGKLPLYRSYYSFDEEVLEHFRFRKSIKNYPGKYYLDKITFDIDLNKNKDEICLMGAKVFIDKLIDEWKIDPDSIEPWYSGSGYHITIPNIFSFKPSNNLPDIVNTTLTKYFPEADSHVYVHSGLIRVGQTINQKTLRYKVPLTIDELNWDTIMELSKGQRKFKRETTEYEIPDYSSLTLYTPEVKRGPKKLDDTNRIVTCMQKLYSEAPTEGSRHVKILRMASAFRRAGIPYSGIVALMQKWAYSMHDEEVEKIVHSVFTTGYRYSCTDTIMSHYCDEKCIFYQNKNYSPDIHSAIDLEKEYVKFVNSDFSTNSFDLAEIYDMPTFKVYPGEMVVFWGDTGVGKSAIVQNVVTKIDLPTLYFSLEMPSKLTYRRFIQIAHEMTKEDIDNYYKAHTNTLSNKIGHINVISISPELDMIQRLIADANPKVVVIDVADCISVKGYRDDKIDPIANGLRDIAQRMNIIVIVIHHISKHAAETGITVHSGKGSSAIEQKADKVISIEGTQNNQNKVIRSLKARDEMPFRITGYLDPRTFIFHQTS